MNTIGIREVYHEIDGPVSWNETGQSSVDRSPSSNGLCTPVRTGKRCRRANTKTSDILFHYQHLGLARRIRSGIKSRDVSTTGFHVDCVQRSAASHEQTIAFRSAKADITADLGEADLSDSNAFG